MLLSVASTETVPDPPQALRNMPPFPPVAARLIRLISQDEPCFKEIADLIRVDVAFSTEILRLANSPVFAFRHEIVDIPHAVAVLGLNRLSGLIMIVSMKDLILGARHHDSLKQSWRHNLACALAAELLAEASWIDKGLGYTAGLLHDVGMLAMACSNIDIYTRLMGTDEHDMANFRECERELLGIDHCEAGRWLLEDLELPVVFQQAAARHHDPPSDDEFESTDLVRKACQVADMTGFAICGEPPPWDPQVPLSWLNESAQERFKDEFKDLPDNIAMKINSFECDFLI